MLINDYLTLNVGCNGTDCETLMNTSKADPISDKIPNYSRLEILIFALPSLLGIIAFLFPIPYQNQINVPLGIISEILSELIKPLAPHLVTTLICLSAACSFIYMFYRRKHPIQTHGRSLLSLIDSALSAKPYYLVIRIMGASLALLTLFRLAPGFLHIEETSAEMLSLLGTLLAWFFAASFLIPLLMNYGIMEFVGVFVEPLTKPLFKLPGRAAVDLLASWVGNCNVGVVLTAQQYKEGFYSAREAASIATCFSAVSLPFCLVIAKLLNVADNFFIFYTSVLIVSTLTTLIMVRIPPISHIPQLFFINVDPKNHVKQKPKGCGYFKWALHLATQRARQAPSILETFYDGANIFIGVIFALMPTVMVYGTCALFIARHTLILNHLSLPFAYILQLLGVPEAFEAAPATIAGFADMIIPSVLGAQLNSYATRFVIGVLSLVQIVYMTEVGTLILTSDIPLSFSKLCIIFLERTVIALPLIVIFIRVIGIL